MKLSPITYAISAGAGIEFNNKIIITATYMLPTNIGAFVHYTPLLSGIHLGVGYKFIR